MTEQKQIEEMQTVINCAVFADFKNGHSVCIKTISDHLYTAGYRKQSEGEWITIIDEPTPLRECAILSGYECSECGRYEKEKQPYCNCGARMKGDRNAD